MYFVICLVFCVVRLKFPLSCLQEDKLHGIELFYQNMCVFITYNFKKNKKTCS